MFLVVNAICQNFNILLLVYYVKLIMKILFIIIPIGLIIKIILKCNKTIISVEKTKQNFKEIGIKIIIPILIFLIYPIINLIFSLDILSNKEYLSCWNNATNLKEFESYNKTIALNINEFETESIQELLNFSKYGSSLKLQTSIQNTFSSFNLNNFKYYTQQLNSNYEIETNQIELSCDDDTVEDYEETSEIITNNEYKSDYTIFVGDSRTVGMCSYLGNIMPYTESCVAEVGKSLSWFKNVAILEVNNILNSNPGNIYNIVIDLGVNDLGYNNAINYSNTYNELKNSSWSRHNIIITSVTPVNESNFERIYYTKNFNSEIINFNNNLKSSLNSNITYCDIFDSVLSLINNNNGAIEPDGLHYTKFGSENIYYLKKNCIK